MYPSLRTISPLPTPPVRPLSTEIVTIAGITLLATCTALQTLSVDAVDDIEDALDDPAGKSRPPKMPPRNPATTASTIASTMNPPPARRRRGLWPGCAGGAELTGSAAPG